jgi:hypothetical protein
MGSQALGGKAEQTGAAADIEEGLAIELLESEKLAKRSLRLLYALLIENA